MAKENKWTKNGENILSEDNLAAIKTHLNTVNNIAVLHWHYYGGRAPTPLAFDDYEEFEEYLNKNVNAGDAIDVWTFPGKHNERIAGGKYPNENGEVPEGGAY